MPVMNIRLFIIKHYYYENSFSLALLITACTVYHYFNVFFTTCIHGPCCHFHALPLFSNLFSQLVSY